MSTVFLDRVGVGCRMLLCLVGDSENDDDDVTVGPKVNTYVHMHMQTCVTQTARAACRQTARAVKDRR